MLAPLVYCITRVVANLSKLDCIYTCHSIGNLKFVTAVRCWRSDWVEPHYLFNFPFAAVGFNRMKYSPFFATRMAERRRFHERHSDLNSVARGSQASRIIDRHIDGERDEAQTYPVALSAIRREQRHYIIRARMKRGRAVDLLWPTKDTKTGAEKDGSFCCNVLFLFHGIDPRSPYICATSSFSVPRMVAP